MTNDVDEQMVRSQAVEVFGSRKAAERWFRTRAMALGQRRPGELMSTQKAGTP